MGKPVKILITIALLIGIISLSLAVISAREEGLSIMDLGQIFQDNMDELNMSPGFQDFSDVREMIVMDEEDSLNIIITNTFPDLVIIADSDMRLELQGDVSTRLDQLVSWTREEDTLYIDLASVFNENPTSTGLRAVLTLPGELESLKVTSISGDVRIQGIVSEEMDLEVMSGNVTLEDSETDSLRILSQSGNIQLFSGYQTGVTLQSVSGNIHVESPGLAGSIKSGSGTLYAVIDNLLADLSMTTDSGNISVTHQGNDYEVDLESRSGMVSAVDFGMKSSSFRGSKGAPEYLLKVESTSGDITFEGGDFMR